MIVGALKKQKKMPKSGKTEMKEDDASRNDIGVAGGSSSASMAANLADSAEPVSTFKRPKGHFARVAKKRKQPLTDGEPKKTNELPLT